MAELSPAAQDVKDAVLALYADRNLHEFGWQLDAPTVAATLRSAAKRLALDPGANSAGGQLLSCKDQLLAMADELSPVTISSRCPGDT
jgi:hypothetical protein